MTALPGPPGSSLASARPATPGSVLAAGPAVPRWHSRGYLPHFDSPDAIQHVTWHMADGLPAAVLADLQEELRTVPAGQEKAARRQRLEELLGAGYGCCILREPAAAEIVQESLLHFDGQRYTLFALVVMPNHVHVIFQPAPGFSVARIVASWKSYTGRRIAETIDRFGWQVRARGLYLQEHMRIWQWEYWDRYMRNERHFWTAVAYVHNNPAKAGLVPTAEEWLWSSARLEGARPEPSGPGGAGLEAGGPSEGIAA